MQINVDVSEISKIVQHGLTIILNLAFIFPSF